MSCVHVMASPDSNAGVLVCSECFERSGHKKAKILLESICLDPSSHGESTRVRVHLIAGVLSPEVRPTPRAHFRGEFILCTKPKCEGLKCKYPHCLKEKAAWNAEKFGYSKCTFLAYCCGIPRRHKGKVMFCVTCTTM